MREASSLPCEQEAQPQRPRPIFILGILPRSGTNFLHRLLCLHPDCQPARPWEDFLVYQAPLLQAYAHAVAAEWHPETARRLAGLIDDPPATLLRHLGDGLLGLLADPQPQPRRIVSKTPWVRHLDALFTLFPDAQLLILVRDGRAVVESGARSFWWDYRSAMQQWATAAQAILDFQECHGHQAERFRVVRYEDLHLNTEAAMDGILRFLGLAPDAYDFAAALRCPVLGSSDALRSGAGGLDHAQERGPHFAPLERWREWGDDKLGAFNVIAGSAMLAFGYPLAGPGAARAPAMGAGRPRPAGDGEVPSIPAADADPRAHHRAQVRRLLDDYLHEIVEPIALRGHPELELDGQPNRPGPSLAPSGAWSPLVSVILPVYNMAEHLPRAIDGILAQTYEHLELILIDDGSGDAAPAIVADYAGRDARVRAFRNPTNLGLIATLNRGLALAAGELIARQDADNWSFPTRLATQVRHLETHPDIGLVATRVYIVEDPAAERSDAIFPAIYVPPTLIPWELLFNCCFSHDTVVMRRRVVEAADGYRSDRLHAEDYDLWSRIADTAWIALLPEVLATWYRNPQGVGGQHTQTQGQTARAIARDGMSRLLGQPLAAASADRVLDLFHGNPLACEAELNAAAALLDRLQARYRAVVGLTPAETALIEAQIASCTAAARACLLAQRMMKEGAA